MAIDISHYRFVPIETATQPPGGLIEHIRDRYWMVHPERGVAFYVGARGKHESAQCNENESIVRRIASEAAPWAEIRFIPSVFRRIDPHDYCNC